MNFKLQQIIMKDKEDACMVCDLAALVRHEREPQ